jgi:hypothetical membrane protein
VNIRIFARAGIVGPVLFFGVLILQDQLARGYHPARQFISELAGGPDGWIQTTNFLVFGVLLVMFAQAIPDGIAPGWPTRAGAWLFRFIGASVFGCGVFRPESWPPTSMSAGGILHLSFAIVGVFLLMPAVCFVLARAFARDRTLSNLVPYTLATGVATTVLFVGGISLMSAPGAPPRIGNLYGGLIQRLDVGLFLLWQVIVAIRLARAARSS